MKRSERERLRQPKPHTVAGFSAAAAQGLLPLVPTSAPTTSTGLLVPSANALLRTHVARFASMTVVFIIVVFGAFPRLTLPAWFEVALVLTLTVGWFVLMLRMAQVPARRTLDEMMYGYSTLTDNGPNYSVGSEHSWGEGGAPWDSSGIWVLDRRFAVTSSPNRQVDPPGFYPSPHRTGQWELWTGVVWSGMYRDEPWQQTS